ncbi:hypothetical protein D1007_59450 [Hordeum vulgare]|nr:hypothetical protein D1007_59450 [Hordeum vulgare]
MAEEELAYLLSTREREEEDGKGGGGAWRNPRTRLGRQGINRGGEGGRLDVLVEEALPDAPILSDEEDEKLYPGYVQQNNEEHAANEDYIPAEFSHTDEDERREDHDIGVFEDADEDRPVMMYDRDNPSIDERVVFPEAVDCRNSVETFSIKFENEYITLKSDQSSLEVSSVMVTLLQPHHKRASFNPHFFLSQSPVKL